MPEFLPELKTFLDESNAKLVESLLESLKIHELDEILVKKFEATWNALPPACNFAPRDLAVCATDGSFGARRLINGMTFAVSRALAISNIKEEVKKLWGGFVTSSSLNAQGDISDYISYQTEHQEHKAILAFFENHAGDGTPLLALMDGSIYGRLRRFFVELPINEDPGFMVKYHETFTTLLHKLLSNPNLHLIGVSKDSNTRFINKTFYAEIVKDVLDDVGPLFPADDLAVLTEILDLDNKTNYTTRSRFQALIQDATSARNNMLDELFRYKEYKLPDFYFIDKYLRGTPGFSKPFVLIPRDEMRGAKRVHAGTVAQLFPRTLARIQDDRRDEASRAIVSIHANLTSIPPVVTSYATLGQNDTPVRIDFLANSDDLQAGFNDVPAMEQYVSWLRACYGGLDNYNIFLTQVDQRVKLTNQILDNLYKQLFEQSIKKPLIYSRDQRRLKTYKRTG